MLLVLSNGGRGAAPVSALLDSLGADYVFHFPTLEDAGGFGRGDVFVGKLSYKSLIRMIRQNRVNAIIDIITTPAASDSHVAVNAADDLKIPVIKLIRPTVPEGTRIAAEPGWVKCEINYSYAAVAEKINKTVGTTVFLARPVSVRAVADAVFDRSELYVPVGASAEFDVDAALEYGIPLINVREYNNLNSREGIREALKDVGAKLLITDSATDIAEKLSAAGDAGAEIIFTQGSGYDYEYIFDNIDGLSECLIENGFVSGANRAEMENETETEDNSGEGDEE